MVLPATHPERRGAFGVAAVLFVLSGACGLAYQVVWVKLLALQFGSSAWSISTVVAAFMAGLGLGSWWAGRTAARIRRPFLVYGLLELGIALFGLASIPVLQRLDIAVAPLYHLLEGRFGWFVAARFVFSFALLLGPTVLMGASLPVLVVGLARRGGFQQAVGLLYGFNTLGAAAGVVATGFVLLPAIGLAGTVWVAAATGLVVAAIAAAWDLFAGAGEAAPARPVDEAGSGGRGLHAALLLAGALGVYYEVIWTRLLAVVVGSSTYAFSIILATFLAGIGAGGLLAGGPLAPRRARRAWLGLLLGGGSLAVVGGLFLVNYLPQIFFRLARDSGGRIGLLFFSQGAVAGSLLLLPTLAMGITLPLAIAAYRDETGDDGRAVGGLYAANTLGAIGGSLLAGFVCLPWLGVRGSILAGGALGLLVGLALIGSERAVAPARRLALCGVLLALLAGLARVAPPVDQQHLQFGIFRQILQARRVVEHGPDLLFVRDGTSSTVSVYRNEETTFLKVNAKTDASTSGDLQTQYLLGHLPVLLCRKPRSACVIGYGSGATVAAVEAHGLERIDVVELERAVIEASPYFRSVHDDVLNQPHVALHYEDGRSFLRYRRTRYDVIVSEPSNPWVAGVSALFTSEFYRMVRGRLAPGGRFCQWIQRYEISEETLRVMLSTLAGEFPHVLIFLVGEDLVCVAAAEPIRGDPARFERALSRPAVRRTLARIKLRSAVDLLLAYHAEFPADLPRFASPQRNRDGNLWLEYRAPLEMYRGAQGAKLRVLPPAAQLAGMSRCLFPGMPRVELALALADSVARLHPRQHAWLEQLAVAAGDAPARRRIGELARRAQRRWDRIKDNDNRLALARKELRGGNARHVVRLTDAVLQGEPGRAAAHRLKGEALVALGREREAERHLRGATRHHPLDYIARTRLGELLCRAGRAAEGEAELLRAVDDNPTYLPAVSAAIRLHRRAGQAARAEALLRRARRQMPPPRYAGLLAALGQ